MISFKKTFAYMVLSPYSFVLLSFNLYLEKWDSCSWFYLVESNTYMYKYTQNQECSERILLQQKILWYTTQQCRIREKIDGGHWPIALRDKALGSEKWKTKKKKKLKTLHMWLWWSLEYERRNLKTGKIPIFKTEQKNRF